MYTSLLHSGEFVDYDGNIVTIEFFKKVDLNTNPSSLTFSDAGGFKSLTIWSRDGDAELYDPQVDWLSYQQIHSEPVVGTDYYKYTYKIICDSNSGDERSSVLHIGIEGMGGIIIDVPVTQMGDE